jgi:hypothetical protein
VFLFALICVLVVAATLVFNGIRNKKALKISIKKFFLKIENIFKSISVFNFEFILKGGNQPGPWYNYVWSKKGLDIDTIKNNKPLISSSSNQNNKPQELKINSLSSVRVEKETNEKQVEFRSNEDDKNDSGAESDTTYKYF